MPSVSRTCVKTSALSTLMTSDMPTLPETRDDRTIPEDLWRFTLPKTAVILIVPYAAHDSPDCLSASAPAPFQRHRSLPCPFLRAGQTWSEAGCRRGAGRCTMTDACSGIGADAGSLQGEHTGEDGSGLKKSQGGKIMKIGVLGSGDVGRTLGAGFLKHGHEVTLGTRDPKKKEVQDWVRETPGARVGSFEE